MNEEPDKPNEDEEEYVEREDLDEEVEEAVDMFEDLIEIVDEIGPASALHTIGKYLEGMAKAYKKLAKDTLELADRCARRFNIIVDLSNREKEEVEDGNEKKPTGEDDDNEAISDAGEGDAPTDQGRKEGDETE